MGITLRGSQLRTLLLRLKELPRSNLVTGELQSTLDNKFNHFDFIVDTWPNFKALLLRPDLTNPQIKYLHDKMQVYAQEPDTLKNLLQNNDLFDWSKSLKIAAIDSRLESAVRDVASEHGQSVIRKTCCHMFRVNRMKRKLHPVPVGLFLSSLHPDQCELVSSYWPYSGDGSTAYIRLLIETYPSCCLYNTDGHILGYGLSYHHGCMGMLHVMEKHRGNGYGKVISSQLANRWLQTCDWLYCFIGTDNKASVRLHKNLGWEIMEDFKIIWRLNIQ